MTKWSVYKLCEPREGNPIYIGCSKNLASARNRHKNDPASAACGHPFVLVVVATFCDKYEATREEGRLIAETPGLLNRNRSLGLSSRNPTRAETQTARSG